MKLNADLSSMKLDEFLHIGNAIFQLGVEKQVGCFPQHSKAYYQIKRALVFCATVHELKKPKCLDSYHSADSM